MTLLYPIKKPLSKGVLIGISKVGLKDLTDEYLLCYNIGRLDEVFF